MSRVNNVSVLLNEDEYKNLLVLIEELDKRSFKTPSQAESIRHAIKFMKDNIDMPKSLEVLKKRLGEVEKELEESKRKNELFEQAFLEFGNKIKHTRQVN